MRRFAAILVIISFCLNLACATKGEPDQVERPWSPSQELMEKYSSYKNHSYYLDGTNNCDSLLFDALMSVAKQDIFFELRPYMDNSGAFHRTTSHNCYPDRSQSTISRDMLWGVMWHLWVYKKKDLAEEILNYAILNKWIMGKGPISRTMMTPTLMYMLANIVSKLGGTSHAVLLNLPTASGSEVEGFEAHLQFLYLTLRANMGMDTDMAKLEALHKANPNNPLFAVPVNRAEAERLLLQEQYWPSNGIATTANYCTDWLTQRSEMRDGQKSKDWLPCTDEGIVQHSGGDFLFATWLLMNWKYQ